MKNNKNNPGHEALHNLYMSIMFVLGEYKEYLEVKFKKNLAHVLIIPKEDYRLEAVYQLGFCGFFKISPEDCNSEVECLLSETGIAFGLSVLGSGGKIQKKEDELLQEIKTFEASGERGLFLQTSVERMQYYILNNEEPSNENLLFEK